MRFVSLLVLCMLSFSSLADDTAEVRLERSWGLQLGDELMLEVRLPDPDITLDTGALPQRDRRHGAWLHLLRTEFTDTGLNMYFQLVNVPIEKQILETPEFTLRTTDGDFIKVPGVPMTIGSMLATDLGDIRASMMEADHPAVLLSTETPRQQMQLALFVFLLTVIVLLAWHLGLRPRHRKPFANAVFRLFIMKWRRQRDPDIAARLLHEAINQTAGTVVVHSRLDAVWQAAPWLEPMQQEIEHFYQQSSAHFFARDSVAVTDFDQVFSLAKACRAREKLA